MKKALEVILLLALLLAGSAARAQTPPSSQDAPVMQTGPVNIPNAVDTLNIPSEQVKTDAMQQTLDLLAQLPQATQKRLLDEADRNKDYCHRNTMLTNFFDCSCFSLRMLDSRIKAGPRTPMVNMISGTDLSMCADSAAAAGFFYQRCAAVLHMEHLSDDDEKAACECGARGAAIEWEHTPSQSVRVANSLFMKNMGICQQQLRPASSMPKP